jgi:hypothetical protein
MKAWFGVVVVLACAAQPAFAQGYSTSFDDLTGWLPGSTSPPVNWANDGTPSTVPGGAARTGANSLNYNNGTNYDSPGISNSGPCFSPVLSLAGLTNPTLSFWCNFHTQPGSEDALSFRDSRQIAIAPGYPFPLINETLGVTNGGTLVGPCSAMGTWHRHTITLDPAWGIIQVAFLFSTVDMAGNDYGGWFIDDFAVGEPPPPVTPPPPGPGPGPTPPPTTPPSGSRGSGDGSKPCGCGAVSLRGSSLVALILAFLGVLFFPRKETRTSM